MKTLEMTKEEALAKFLDCEVDDISVTKYDDDTFDAPYGEYMVLTDEEADRKAKDYILDTAWTFNASFLVGHVPDGVTEDILSMISEKCEDGNSAMLGLIQDHDAFVDDAISAEGRGPFLSTYDGEENEQGEYYIYRVN